MRRQSVVLIVSGIAVVAAAAAGLYWWQVQRAHALPAYIVKTNGRLEFARIDIAVKNPGRIVELSVHEGEHATAGEILAKQDDAELNTQRAGASAQRAEAPWIFRPRHCSPGTSPLPPLSKSAWHGEAFPPS